VDEDTVIRRRLAFDNVDLIQRALRYTNGAGILNTEDLRLCGWLGLLRAAEQYEPDHGSFRVYAYPRVVRAIMEVLRRHGPARVS
jgi:DNA-directed RNA polymerase specialized sigma subunit